LCNKTAGVLRSARKRIYYRYGQVKSSFLSPVTDANPHEIRPAARCSTASGASETCNSAKRTAAGSPPEARGASVPRARPRSVQISWDLRSDRALAHCFLEHIFGPVLPFGPNMLSSAGSSRHHQATHSPGSCGPPPQSIGPDRSKLNRTEPCPRLSRLVVRVPHSIQFQHLPHCCEALHGSQASRRPSCESRPASRLGRSRRTCANHPGSIVGPNDDSLPDQLAETRNRLRDAASYLTSWASIPAVRVPIASP